MKIQKIDDPCFGVYPLPYGNSREPNRMVWTAMHQDYSEDPVYICVPPDERKAGDIIVKRLLDGKRGHWGCLEHAHLAVNVVGYPHIVMQQLRTHRNVSFDVQSSRYTGKRVLEYLKGTRSFESVFYQRPIGVYSDRQGKRYEVTEATLYREWLQMQQFAQYYFQMIEGYGFSEEHSRGVMPYNIRQHFVLSGNARAMMHLFDVRYKPDVELETFDCVSRIWEVFKSWMPEVAAYYEKDRLGKAVLAP